MKILIDHHYPFQIAHGGLQIQVEQTFKALRNLGVDVEYLRWWDETQTGDLIHYFGRPAPNYIRGARKKGIRFVFTELLGATGARSPGTLRVQWLTNRVFERCAPRIVVDRMWWDSYQVTDACIALTGWEAHLIHWLFNAPPDRVRVIGNGVETEFLEPEASVRGKWLVTTASILPVKRIVETAQAAAETQTPYWVIGRPFSEDDPYFGEFRSLQKRHPEVIRYEGAISDRRQLAQVYREARGFVMLSQWESLSISALEAAACGCPLLLSDLPWAHSVFGDAATFCRWDASVEERKRVLSRFYEAAPSLPVPPQPLGWQEIAESLRSLYKSLLDTK
ncbi:MAG: glycosyltransferase family 4 protein [Chthoniobacteraceae bacterium]